MLKGRATEILLQLVDDILQLLAPLILLEVILTLSIIFALELVLLLSIVVDVSLVSENLVRKRKALSLPALAFGVPVLDIMNDEAAILASCKQVIVIIAKSHPCDALRVRLHLVDLVHFELLSSSSLL